MLNPSFSTGCHKCSTSFGATASQGLLKRPLLLATRHTRINLRSTPQIYGLSTSGRSTLIVQAASSSGPEPPGRAAPVKYIERPATNWGLEATPQTASPSTTKRASPPGPGEEPQGWGVFDLQRYDYRWNVPWGAGTTVGGMVLWFVSFLAVGFIAVPGLYKLSGSDLSSLGMRDKAVFTLACQALETVVGLAVIRVMTAKALKEAEPPANKSDELFNFSLREPFKAPYGWAAWALGGVVLSPFVVGAVATAVSVVGYDSQVGGRGTVDGVATMISIDAPTYLSLLGVTGFLAPLLEETVFRGFLLVSLTRWMPTWAAVLLSSAGFGLAHASQRDLPVLCALGVLLGVSYVRSRNLLTPIIIHGTWNSTVLTLLFALAASGIDVEAALREMR